MQSNRWHIAYAINAILSDFMHLPEADQRLFANQETGGYRQVEEIPWCCFSVSTWWRGEPDAPERPNLLSQLPRTLRPQFAPDPFRRGTFSHIQWGRPLPSPRLWAFLRPFRTRLASSTASMGFTFSGAIASRTASAQYCCQTTRANKFLSPAPVTALMRTTWNWEV